MGIIVQLITAVILCISCVNMGITIAWPSSTLLLFKSENTTLNRPMTDLDAALFGSLPILGSFIAQPLINIFVLKYLGLKRTSMLVSLLYAVAWSVVILSNTVEAVLLSSVLTGFGDVIFVVVSIYICEISQDSIRGTLTSGPNLSCSLGLVVSYTIGGALEYHTMLYTYLSLSVLGVVMISVLKESPVQLMAKGKEEEALKSLAFYRQTSCTSREVLLEMNNIRRSLNLEFEDAKSLVKEKKQNNPKEDKKKTLSCWQIFKNTSSIRRQFYLTLVLQTAFVCQGLPILQVYAEPIFVETVGNTISPYLCTILFGLVILIAGVVAAYLTDHLGRRPLQIHSSTVGGFCCLILGTQIVTEWLPMWTTPLLIYIFAIAHTVGSGTIPFVIAAEIFLPEVKSKLLVLTFEWGYMCSFSGMFLFSIVTQSFGLAPAFYFFSVICLLTNIYFFYFLPETKGIPVYAIQALFTKKDDKINEDCKYLNGINDL